MSLFDKFKKKIKETPPSKQERPVIDEKIKKPEIKEQVPKVSAEKIAMAYKIIKEPRITEKASFLAEQNKYVFEVYPSANKIEIKKAVESIYNTKVSKVHIIHSGPKKRRLGRREGWRHGLKRGFKKAVVTLKQGEKIELLPK